MNQIKVCRTDRMCSETAGNSMGLVVLWQHLNRDYLLRLYVAQMDD